MSGEVRWMRCESVRGEGMRGEGVWLVGVRGRGWKEEISDEG